MSLTIAIRKYFMPDLPLKEVQMQLSKLTVKDKQDLAKWFTGDKIVLNELKTDSVEYKSVQ